MKVKEQVKVEIKVKVKVKVKMRKDNYVRYCYVMATKSSIRNADRASVTLKVTK